MPEIRKKRCIDEQGTIYKKAGKSVIDLPL